MATETLTGARIPDLSYAPDISQLGISVRDIAGNTIPRFASTSARDTAYAAYVAQGYTLSAGMLCAVAGVAYRYSGTTWVQMGRDTTVGDGFLGAQTLITTTTTWTDVATVVGTSTGGSCIARMSAQAWNSDTGADRTCDIRVTCDGTQIGLFSGILMHKAPAAGIPGAPHCRFGVWATTPAAGTHTWIVQTRASVASAVFMGTAMLSVVEKN